MSLEPILESTECWCFVAHCSLCLKYDKHTIESRTRFDGFKYLAVVATHLDDWYNA